jgi:hypothetical protein
MSRQLFRTVLGLSVVVLLAGCEAITGVAPTSGVFGDPVTITASNDPWAAPSDCEVE